MPFKFERQVGESDSEGEVVRYGGGVDKYGIEEGGLK